jgi:phenylacetic acid degradation protein
LIGMNAVIMDDVTIGAECIVGALAFVPAGTTIEPRKVVVGNPAKVVKDVTDEMIRWKTEGTQLYQALPGAMRESWRECEPLREVPANRPDQAAVYRTWRESREG